MDLSKPILITGASGYIGSQFLHALVGAGATQVYCLTSTSRSSAVSHFWIECNITDRNKVFDVFRHIRPSYIFHFAALGARATQTTFSLERFLHVNTFGTQNLIDASIESGVCEGFVNISTAYEYGPHKNPISEMTDFSPHGNYAISKYIGSVYLDQKIHSLGFPGITYRLFSVYGQDDFGRIIPLVIEALKSNKKLELFDIQRKRDFVYIDTVISAILKFDIIRKNNITSLNIGSGESITIYDLVRQISQILNIPILENIIFDKTTPADTHWECDNTLLKQYIDSVSLPDGLSEILK